MTCRCWSGAAICCSSPGSGSPTWDPGYLLRRRYGAQFSTLLGALCSAVDWVAWPRIALPPLSLVRIIHRRWRDADGCWAPSPLSGRAAAQLSLAVFDNGHRREPGAGYHTIPASPSACVALPPAGIDALFSMDRFGRSLIISRSSSGRASFVTGKTISVWHLRSLALHASSYSRLKCFLVILSTVFPFLESGRFSSSKYHRVVLLMLLPRTQARPLPLLSSPFPPLPHAARV